MTITTELPATATLRRDDPEGFASAIGLCYTRSGSSPCIERRRAGRGFTYQHTELGGIRRGHPLRPWLDGLALPPAWTDVWISPVRDGHLLATGYDDADRKQYRYHERWSEARRTHHDASLVRFARSLPDLRRATARLVEDAEPARQMLAAAVRVLDRTGIRIGNRSSFEEHATRGLTTLVDANAEVRGPRISLSFLGKGGTKRAIDLRDPAVASLLEDTAQHDDAHLFSWEDDCGGGHVTARMVNRFLRAHQGPSAHAHQFRSWLCTWQTLAGLRDAGPQGDIGVLLDVLAPIAERLGHTVSTARGHYLHHLVERAWMGGDLPRVHPVRVDGLSLDERRAIAVLEALEGNR